LGLSIAKRGVLPSAIESLLERRGEGRGGGPGRRTGVKFLPGRGSKSALVKEEDYGKIFPFKRKRAVVPAGLGHRRREGRRGFSPACRNPRNDLLLIFDQAEKKKEVGIEYFCKGIVAGEKGIGRTQ